MPCRGINNATQNKSTESAEPLPSDGVIHEGMPGASFTISFNCLADLVSIIMLE